MTSFIIQNYKFIVRELSNSKITVKVLVDNENEYYYEEIYDICLKILFIPDKIKKINVSANDLCINMDNIIIKMPKITCDEVGLRILKFNEELKNFKNKKKKI